MAHVPKSANHGGVTGVLVVTVMCCVDSIFLHINNWLYIYIYAYVYVQVCIEHVYIKTVKLSLGARRGRPSSSPVARILG